MWLFLKLVTLFILRKVPPKSIRDLKTKYGNVIKARLDIREKLTKSELDITSIMISYFPSQAIIIFCLDND